MGVGSGRGAEGQGGYERRMEVILKMQKKKSGGGIRSGGGRGGGGVRSVGGSGWMCTKNCSYCENAKKVGGGDRIGVYEELKFL